MAEPENLSEFDKILLHFTQSGGSDLFVTAGRPITMKKDGHLETITEDVIDPEMATLLTELMMNDDQRAIFHETQECNFAYHIPGTARYRVNIFMQRGTPGMVIRSVHTDIPEFETLNLPPVMKEFIKEKNGLLLMVGGTGSGKSTTLASLIGVRNQTMDGHIITIEDPIEFVHSHKKSIITQREVGVDTESYEAALKNTLRQAPNVILIGEIRSHETMEHAIAFAETGHLCVSTLHANNTNQTLDRIVNFFPAIQKNHILMDLSLNLKAIVSQRLIPKIGGGRIAAVEVLINTPRVSELIMQGNVGALKEIMQKSSAIGMQTFDQALFDLYESQQITYQDALRYADSANDLRLNIKLNSKLPPPEGIGMDEASALSLRGDAEE
ncbi:PilT/PilU family type 4a pilus ATPase [Thiomicrorhabdus sediminis]|uniref:PilT/PilU family type 4a pilus ATPase n=1 Tax=Thiomicrorhabdus sediminis TaxID=2580412 RepID=A0A4P9K3W3_9GAMM|nr:PilT/PilU family type 4a pilus ATPase [Thiomicrorhabdus sediminis]QCU89579.1 PilT/PilU family type 4a pilus ATPase [Thiomicrorhabdus sediminis]